MSENLLETKKDTKLRIFNEAVEYMNKFDNLNNINIEENLGNNSLGLLNNNRLRDEMLSELNHLKDIIINNPDIKLNKLSEEEKELYNKFIKHFSYCPTCGNVNHYYNLKNMYFDDRLINLKESLIKLMYFEDEKIKKYNIVFGIPCCSCYKDIFE
ncbi:MAG: hypothetical protein KGD57_09080 [Candidatus Lokiarchaeota archaeon]|nr:hypothetical protein [Candidatus Lokiarchaeota archaeon]